jgi:hypothetical protein
MRAASKARRDLFRSPLYLQSRTARGGVVICSICTALEFASRDQLERLVQQQASRLGLTCPTCEPIAPSKAPVSSKDAASDLEALMAHDDIFRRPPRAAAPRLIERLAELGYTLEKR